MTERWTYTRGLHDIGDGLFAWLQPDGGWGWSNAGLIVGGDRSLLVDTAGLYARARDKSEEFQPDGFMFLARVLAREVERLYRLYHGHPPHDR